MTLFKKKKSEYTWFGSEEDEMTRKINKRLLLFFLEIMAWSLFQFGLWNLFDMYDPPSRSLYYWIALIIGIILAILSVLLTVKHSKEKK